MRIFMTVANYMKLYCKSGLFTWEKIYTSCRVCLKLHKITRAYDKKIKTQFGKSGIRVLNIHAYCLTIENTYFNTLTAT